MAHYLLEVPFLKSAPPTDCLFTEPFFEMRTLSIAMAFVAMQFVWFLGTWGSFLLLRGRVKYPKGTPEFQIPQVLKVPGLSVSRVVSRVVV